MRNFRKKKESIELWPGIQLFAFILVLLLITIYSCREAEPDPSLKPLPDVFAQKLEDTLKDRGIGYAFAIYDGTQLTAKGSGGFQSRSNDPEGQKDFTADTKMHIASMTKTLTAMAFLKTAAQKGVKTTDLIAPYLPPSWKIGTGIGQITFSDLLTHKSGIKGLSGSCLNGSDSENNYDGLKKIVALGVTSRGNYCYQNANFGLFRVLIPRLLGYTFTGNDVTDDAQTRQLYLTFLQQEIFEKAGVSNVITTFPVNNPTYTYNAPLTDTQKGWNPGNFSQVFGGYGMYLTASEAGKIYASALSSGTNDVLPTALADSLLVKNLGCYKAAANLGTIAYHDGLWFDWINPAGRGLRTLWVKFPNNITCVLFVNALHYQNNSLVFPFNNGDIVSFIYNAYAKAVQARGARISAEADLLYIEHPEPH